MQCRYSVPCICMGRKGDNNSRIMGVVVVVKTEVLVKAIYLTIIMKLNVTLSILYISNIPDPTVTVMTGFEFVYREIGR